GALRDFYRARDGGINIAQIDVMVPDVTTPIGEMDIHTTCAAGVTSNGCLRLAIKQGISAVAADGNFNDNGQGSITAPVTGGYYLGTNPFAGGTFYVLNGNYTQGRTA